MPLMILICISCRCYSIIYETLQHFTFLLSVLWWLGVFCWCFSHLAVALYGHVEKLSICMQTLTVLADFLWIFIHSSLCNLSLLWPVCFGCGFFPQYESPLLAFPPPLQTSQHSPHLLQTLASNRSSAASSSCLSHSDWEFKTWHVYCAHSWLCFS